MATQRPAKLYIDQNGERVWARTVRELQQYVHGRVSKMYVDGKDGRTYHVGYVVGQRWFSEFTPTRKPA